MLMICADVLLRNVRLVPGMLGVAWANEVTEYVLYLITMLTAPWLLRQGQHIRVDIAAARDPARGSAWYCEWLVGRDRARLLRGDRVLRRQGRPRPATPSARCRSRR